MVLSNFQLPQPPFDRCPKRHIIVDFISAPASNRPKQDGVSLVNRTDVKHVVAWQIFKKMGPYSTLIRNKIVGACKPWNTV